MPALPLSLLPRGMGDSHVLPMFNSTTSKLSITVIIYDCFLTKNIIIQEITESPKFMHEIHQNVFIDPAHMTSPLKVHTHSWLLL